MNRLVTALSIASLSAVLAGCLGEDTTSQTGTDGLRPDKPGNPVQRPVGPTGHVGNLVGPPPSLGHLDPNRVQVGSWSEQIDTPRSWLCMDCDASMVHTIVANGSGFTDTVTVYNSGARICAIIHNYSANGLDEAAVSSCEWDSNGNTMYPGATLDGQVTASAGLHE